ncbi:unnamed protein product [Nezara viridula]|uniref:Uncharacterized protein n=1 Tax=Nezara viridula TaxID=85310 RepID=A0A9P0H746_NEZVI|nr:unnamed protein product [Nezara viridula]
MTGWLRPEGDEASVRRSDETMWTELCTIQSRTVGAVMPTVHSSFLVITTASISTMVGNIFFLLSAVNEYDNVAVDCDIERIPYTTLRSRTQPTH